MTTYVAYVRVSTNDQERRGSHDIQVNAIKNFCGIQKILLGQIFIDAGQHGWDMGRPEFLNMLAIMKTEEIEGVIIQHSDRFSRGDPIDTLIIYKQLFRTKKKVISLIEGELNLDTLENFLLMSIRTFTNANRIQVDKIKQKAGIQRYKEKHKGKWGKRAYTLDIKKYTEYKSLGLSKTAIAKLLGMSVVTLNKLLLQQNEN